MSINLSKGQRISLEKEAGKALTRVAMGLGWGTKTVHSSGFFGFGKGPKEVSVDLDASCLLFDARQTQLDAIWFRQLRSKDGSIRHSGDDLSGGGGADQPNETIVVDLTSVPADVANIIFTVNSFTGEDFSGIPNAFCNIVDEQTGVEFARFNLSLEAGGYTGLIMAKLYRHEGEWKFHALGESASGRTFHEMLPRIQPHLG
jgi:tellurium resistance protein TerZ